MEAFIITDIHNYYGLMIQALKRKGFDRNNPEHILISCGDLLDRGPKPTECVRFVNDLVEEKRACLVMGNHDVLLEELITGVRKPMQHDFSNGALKTLKILSKDLLGKKLTFDNFNRIMFELNSNKEIRQYFNNLQYSFTFKDYVFTHAWLPVEDGKIRKNYQISDAGWDEAVWLNGMRLWSNGYRLENKTIVCGHWHTSWGHTYLHSIGVEFPETCFSTYEGDPCDHIMHSEPFIDDGIIALDACTALTHKVNVYVIDNFEKQLG